MASVMRAYANSDHAYVVWRYEQPIPGCRGFALYRRRGGVDELMPTWVGWDGDTSPAGTNKPSTQWPIQKFAWSDYDLRTGDTAQYRAVPMVGTKDALAAADAQATDWSEAVILGPQAEGGLEAYVNRGIVAAQWVARSLGAPTSGEMGTKLTEVIATVGDRTRDFLSGALRPALLGLLSEADAGGGTLYAALFELDDPELIAALTALGARAQVVLANGSVSSPDGDENADARQALKQAGVTVHDRMVRSGHLDHHKYLVVCDADDTARSVWTGSTNWTKTGLCTQANNGILIPDATVAGWFKDHWDQLVAAGNGYPRQLLEADTTKRTTTIGDITLTAWLAPVTGQVDLADARARIQAAKDGILFLFFNPGPAGTLLNDIVDRATQGTATYDPHLFIHGALNQDPSTSAHAVTLFHRGNNRLDGDFDVVLPENIDQRFGYWIQEIRKLPHAFAMVHSKVVVIDPFGDHPVVITGSHNLGPKASRANDDNMIIIDNAPRLAAAYAVSVMTVYNQYRWRFIRNQHAQDATTGGSGDGTADTATHPPPAGWAGLQDDDAWQHEYFTSAPKIRELDFWLPPR
jgi:phosphatidylserine/phosphatidylglycerophosphate/cardiolipin synthase-like enzyme